jgi:hypothetical protein
MEERVEDDRTPEIVMLNEAALDVEELESRLEISSSCPDNGCWDNCGINIC